MRPRLAAQRVPPAERRQQHRAAGHAPQAEPFGQGDAGEGHDQEAGGDQAAARRWPGPCASRGEPSASARPTMADMPASTATTARTGCTDVRRGEDPLATTLRALWPTPRTAAAVDGRPTPRIKIELFERNEHRRVEDGPPRRDRGRRRCACAPRAASSSSPGRGSPRRAACRRSAARAACGGSYRPEDLATPEAFARDPHLVWEWYAWRREIDRAACGPTPRTVALAALESADAGVPAGHPERRRPARRGGQPAHGRAARQPLAAPLHGVRLRARGPARAAGRAALRAAPAARCSGPDVVWFGEALPEAAVAAAFAAARAAEVVLVVGTSSLVYPAAALPAGRARGAAPS